MTTPRLTPIDRALELAADRALFGLCEADRCEFVRLSPGALFDEFHVLDFAAGALTIALLNPRDFTPMPQRIEQRVRSAAEAWDAAHGDGAPT